MKKTISFVVVLAMILSFAMTVLPVSALNTADYYELKTTTGNWAYDHGPNFMLAQTTGMFAQTFETTETIVGFGFGCWEQAKDGSTTVDVSFYNYDTDIATSIDGTPVVEMTVNVKEGQMMDGVSGIYDLPHTIPAGKYVIKFSNTNDTGLHFGVGTASQDGAEGFSDGGNNGAVTDGNLVALSIFTNKPSGVVSASDITEGTTTLTRDITGQLRVSSGDYVIDLAGHTWSHTAIAVYVEGANVKIIDSVGGGKIHVRGNDAIDIESGSLTATGITVIAESTGMDAIFVGGGTVVVNDCTLDGGKSGINASQATVDITVNGGTFANDYDGGDSRDAAFEFRNNAKVKLNGDIKFDENAIIRRANHTQSWNDSFVLDGATAVFAETDADLGNISGNPYYANTITYTAPKEPEQPSNPTDEPTAEPTEEPSDEPTAEPTEEPSDEPTVEPTEKPSAEPTTEPTTEPTEKPSAEPTEEPVENKNVLHVSYDEIRPGIICAGKDENIKTPVVEAGTKEATFWGWIALAQNVKSFSYSINGGEKVDQPAAVVEAEQPVLDAVANVEGAVTGSRFRVVVPVTEGTQTIEIFAELEDGTSESFWKAELTVGEPSTDEPSDDDSGNADTGDFMFVIIVAAAAFVVTVLSKKRAF